MNRWFVELTRACDGAPISSGEVVAAAGTEIVGAFVAFALGEQRAHGTWRHAKWRWTLEGFYGIATLPDGRTVECAVDARALD